jgi:hypothetical protein
MATSFLRRAQVGVQRRWHEWLGAATSRDRSGDQTSNDVLFSTGRECDASGLERLSQRVSAARVGRAGATLEIADRFPADTRGGGQVILRPAQQTAGGTALITRDIDLWRGLAPSKGHIGARHRRVLANADRKLTDTPPYLQLQVTRD